MSEIKVDKISPQSGTALQIGDASDVITIPASATITNLGTATGFGGGKVLQVIQTHYITATSQSVADMTQTSITGVNATITPSATSSKVLISIRWAGEFGHTDIHNMSFGIHRGTTAIGNPATAGSRRLGITHVSAGYWNSNADTTPDTVSYEYLDSPSTTSATVYHATVIQAQGTSQTLYTNRTVGDGDNDTCERLTSTITLMEIGA
jgi:hypothetical protein